MDKGRTEDQGKSPAEEHRFQSGNPGEGGGAGSGLPSNADEERLFRRSDQDQGEPASAGDGPSG